MSETPASTTLAAPAKTRPVASAWLRLVGLGGFAGFLLLGPIEFGAILEALRGIAPETWLLAWAMNLAPPSAIAARLQSLLRERGHCVPLGPLVRDAFRSVALNTVTLAGAGDLHRVSRLRARDVPLATGSSVVVLDRVFGVSALAALALLVQASGLGTAGEAWPVPFGLLAMLAAVPVIALVAMRSRFGFGASRLNDRLRSALETGTPSWRASAEATALSFVACGTWIVALAFLGQGLGLALPMLAYLEAVPLVALAALLPISVGGLGVREAGYVVALGGYGVSAPDCIALGIAQYSCLLGVALIGGLLFAWPD